MLECRSPTVTYVLGHRRPQIRTCLKKQRLVSPLTGDIHAGWRARFPARAATARVEPMTARRLRTSWSVILIASAFLATGCHATPPHQSGASPVQVSPAPPPVTPSAAQTSILPHTADHESADDADNPINYVIAISIDGLNPEAIKKLGKSRAPTFYRLMREGAYTLNARTVREKTSTAPNHTAMLTGRRVDAKHGGHGYTENFDNGSTIHQAAGHYVASVFDVVHDRGHSTAFLGAKLKFRLYKRTWNTHGAPDRVGHDDGRAKIDRFTIDRNNTRLVAELTRELRRSPRDFTFLHLSLPDRAGHAHGFMGKQYLAAVKRTDELLGRILETVADRRELRRHTLVILTADHGGRGGSHYDASKLQNFRIPFMTWGAGVPAGRNLYDLNPDFRSPGSRRTSYHGAQPIRNGDLANLATDALDLPHIPGSEFDRSRTLNVFRYER
jgi:Type I phosphodiesterase / nucleotide pyrophosphatase